MKEPRVPGSSKTLKEPEISMKEPTVTKGFGEPWYISLRADLITAGSLPASDNRPAPGGGGGGAKTNSPRQQG
jgi:hypothetical protein